MRRLTPSVTLCVVMTVPILVRPVPAVHAQTTFFSTSFQETENSPVPGNSVTNYADPSTANIHVPSENPTDYRPYTANLRDFLIPASSVECGAGHPDYVDCSSGNLCEITYYVVVQEVVSNPSVGLQWGAIRSLAEWPSRTHYALCWPEVNYGELDNELVNLT